MEDIEKPLFAVLLDRDGVINKEQGHIKTKKDFHILDGVAEAIARVNELGVQVAVLTNQSGIARGYLTEAQLDEIHDDMKNTLAIEGAQIDFLAYSPWLNSPGLEGGVKKYLMDHQDRKPNSGMLHKALGHFELTSDRACYIGDTKKDMLAAHGANMRFFPIHSNKAAEFDNGTTLYPSLWEWVNWACNKGLLIDLQQKGEV